MALRNGLKEMEILWIVFVVLVFPPDTPLLEV